MLSMLVPAKRENSAQFAIRRASVAEGDRSYALVSEYYQAVNVVARDDREEFLRDYFGPGAGFWLASVGDAIAGCIALRPLVGTESAEIKRMYVRPAWRGTGLAERLLEAAECFARQAGYGSIYLDTTDEMKAAVKLYERHGYERSARYNDNPQATIFMKKKL